MAREVDADGTGGRPDPDPPPPISGEGTDIEPDPLAYESMSSSSRKLIVKEQESGREDWR